MSRVWYFVDRNSVYQGPMTRDELENYYCAGELWDECVVWNGQDITTWTHLKLIPHLIGPMTVEKKRREAQAAAMAHKGHHRIRSRTVSGKPDAEMRHGRRRTELTRGLGLGTDGSMGALLAPKRPLPALKKKEMAVGSKRTSYKPKTTGAARYIHPGRSRHKKKKSAKKRPKTEKLAGIKAVAAMIDDFPIEDEPRFFVDGYDTDTKLAEARTAAKKRRSDITKRLGAAEGRRRRRRGYESEDAQTLSPERKLATRVHKQKRKGKAQRGDVVKDKTTGRVSFNFPATVHGDSHHSDDDVLDGDGLAELPLAGLPSPGGMSTKSVPSVFSPKSVCSVPVAGRGIAAHKSQPSAGSTASGISTTSGISVTCSRTKRKFAPRAEHSLGSDASAQLALGLPFVEGEEDEDAKAKETETRGGRYKHSDKLSVDKPPMFHTTSAPMPESGSAKVVAPKSCEFLAAEPMMRRPLTAGAYATGSRLGHRLGRGRGRGRGMHRKQRSQSTIATRPLGGKRVPPPPLPRGVSDAPQRLGMLQQSTRGGMAVCRSVGYVPMAMGWMPPPGVGRGFGDAAVGRREFAVGGVQRGGGAPAAHYLAAATTGIGHSSVPQPYFPFPGTGSTAPYQCQPSLEHWRSSSGPLKLPPPTGYSSDGPAIHQHDASGGRSLQTRVHATQGSGVPLITGCSSDPSSGSKVPVLPQSSTESAAQLIEVRDETSDTPLSQASTASPTSVGKAAIESERSEFEDRLSESKEQILEQLNGVFQSLKEVLDRGVVRCELQLEEYLQHFRVTETRTELLRFHSLTDTTDDVRFSLLSTKPGAALLKSRSIKKKKKKKGKKKEESGTAEPRAAEPWAIVRQQSQQLVEDGIVSPELRSCVSRSIDVCDSDSSLLGTDSDSESQSEDSSESQSQGPEDAEQLQRRLQCSEQKRDALLAKIESVTLKKEWARVKKKVGAIDKAILTG